MVANRLSRYYPEMVVPKDEVDELEFDAFHAGYSAGYGHGTSAVWVIGWLAFIVGFLVAAVVTLP